MKKFIHPLLLLIAQATEKEATKYIEYLKAENRILRSKLPKRVEVTEAERAKLIKLGKRVGSAIKELVSHWPLELVSGDPGPWGEIQTSSWRE